MKEITKNENGWIAGLDFLCENFDEFVSKNWSVLVEITDHEMRLLSDKKEISIKANKDDVLGVAQDIWDERQAKYLLDEMNDRSAEGEIEYD